MTPTTIRQHTIAATATPKSIVDSSSSISFELGNTMYTIRIYRQRCRGCRIAEAVATRTQNHQISSCILFEMSSSILFVVVCLPLISVRVSSFANQNNEKFQPTSQKRKNTDRQSRYNGRFSSRHAGAIDLPIAATQRKFRTSRFHQNQSVIDVSCAPPAASRRICSQRPDRGPCTCMVGVASCCVVFDDSTR
jgi:hypothetical protein